MSAVNAIMRYVRLEPYRRVLARPGTRSLIITTLLARIPITAAPVILTLHVVLDLHLGFTQSGTVAAVTAVGAALGAPLLGRGMDRVGLRPVLVVTTVADGIFWLAAGFLPYRWLLLGAFLGGLLSLPVFSVARQSLAALVPPAERQAGFSLDSMSVELSFAVGPALGVVVLTQAGSVPAFLCAAGLIVVSGLSLMLLNPPIHGEEGTSPTPGSRSRPGGGPVPGVRTWLGPRVLAVLLATSGATITLAGTDVALTAAMRSFGQVNLIGVVVAVWCLASLVGGFVYGASPRRIDPLVLLVLLAGLTVIVAFAGTWWVLALLAVPSGLFCAPLISATAEVLARITPARVRGQVMGLHGSALTAGNAVGAPVVGVIVDHTSPSTGFVGIGLIGVTLAVLGLAGQTLWSRSRPAPVAAPSRDDGAAVPDDRPPTMADSHRP